ncbi:TerB family tellurite resistance protein [Euryarchaeota archaeon]|nr:TerB family tellurite resistance protein [Euryarchaeota archaeon]
MFPDQVNDLTIEERLAHAQLMVAVAASDGELVKEEMIVLEAIMGKSMLHPEMRVDIRNSLNHPHEIEETMRLLSDKGKLLGLRDSIIVAASDGDYDRREIRMIGKIAKLAGVSKETLSQLYQWVEETWNQHKKWNDVLT